MSNTRLLLLPIISAIALSGVSQASTDVAKQILAEYETQAKAEFADFTGFSAERGEQLFTQPHANDWRCSTCHTSDPRQQGKHIKTGKAIDPLAPSANEQRFSKVRKTEKWFRRNCKDVLARTCSSVEKGDILTYLLSL